MNTLVNTAQSQAWNGSEGRHWSDHHERWNAVNEGFDAPLLEAAGIGAGDRVLDIGCGTGQTTRLAARLAAPGAVLGLDLSEPMLARARTLSAAEGLTGVVFRQGDAQVHPFAPGSFDAAISRFGIMFFEDPIAAFTNIRSALRPGGRLAFVCMSDPGLCEWTGLFGALHGTDEEHPSSPAEASAEPGMFSLADPGEVRRVLTAAGFECIGLRPVEYRGRWGADVAATVGFLLSSGPVRHMLDHMDPVATERARQDFTDRLLEHARPSGVYMRTAAWLVTAVRP